MHGAYSVKLKLSNFSQHIYAPAAHKFSLPHSPSFPCTNCFPLLRYFHLPSNIIVSGFSNLTYLSVPFVVYPFTLFKQTGCMASLNDVALWCADRLVKVLAARSTWPEKNYIWPSWNWSEEWRKGDGDRLCNIYVTLDSNIVLLTAENSLTPSPWKTQRKLDTSRGKVCFPNAKSQPKS